MSVPGEQSAPVAQLAAAIEEHGRADARWRRPEALSVLAVVALTLIGLALRLVVCHQSLFADELSTYWIITTHGPRGVLSIVHTDAEITPPLYFVLAWLATQLGHAPELVRAPSLIAGAATIPIVYLLGLRTVGRTAALLATALVALAPFMIYYSAEARAYGLMMALLCLSTLAMLLAVDTGRARWWAVYAVATCGAVYSHYTCVFALGAQLLWLLWAHREHSRPAILATLAAVVGFAPWTTGLINDFTSPTSKILSALSPFTLHDTRIVLEHWSVGYPYATLPLRQLPGSIALVALALALAAAFGGAATTFARRRAAGAMPVAKVDRRLVLVAALALSVPIGEAVASAISTNLFGVRNLAAAWPASALLLAALVVAAGPRLRYVAAALMLTGFAIGAVKTVERRYQRPDFRGAAAFVDDHAARGDVVMDETAELSPGPYSPMDLTLDGGRTVVRSRAPQERDHPFNLFDAEVTSEEAVAKALAAAHGRRVFYVAYLRSARFPASYRLVDSRTFPGFVGLRVQVYAPSRG
jgi:hypothetical protein